MTTVTARTHWERVALTRWGAYLTAAEQAALGRAVQLAGAPGHALEVGAEGGRWAVQLDQLGWTLTCTDVEPSTFAVCKERLPHAHCVLVDAAEATLPAEDGAVQLLVIMEVAPVAESDWMAPEAARVLAPGGVLLTTVVNPTSLRGIVYRVLQRRGRRQHKIYEGPPYRAVRSRLTDSGLRIVEERGYGWGPFTRDSNSRLIPPAVALERLLGLRRLPSLSPFVIVIATK